MSRTQNMRRAVRTLVLTAAAAPLLSPTHTMADSYDLRVIATSGDDAPGSFNGTFVGFHLPSMNELGQITFGGETSTELAATGFWTTEPDDPQTIRFLSGEGWPIPDFGPEVRFGSISYGGFRAYPASNGDIGFSHRIAGVEGHPFPVGIFVNRNGQTETLAIETGQVPGLADGTTFRTILHYHSFSNNGRAAFMATFDGPGVDDSNDTGVFVDWFGGLTLFAREGAPAPGLDDTTWRPVLGGGPFIDNTGRVTFVAELEGDVQASWSIWSGFPGAWELLLKEGDTAPNGESYSSFYGLDDFYVSADGALSLPLFTDDGQNSRRTLSAQKNGVRIMLAAEGTPGPIGTWEGLYPDTGHISAEGSIVFAAMADTAPDVDSGLFIRRPGHTVQTLIREGDPAYSFGPNIVHDHFGTSYGTSTIDDAGRTYFTGNVRGPGINDTNDDAAWVIDPDGTRHLIIRDGQFINVRGQWKQVEYFGIQMYDTSQSGQRGSVSMSGDVALLVSFDDGTQAVVHGLYPRTCPSDLNHDGVVDVDDLLIVLAEWDTTGPYGQGGDADFDGDTDIDDLLQVLADFNLVCN